jgi:hypothetical protein
MRIRYIALAIIGMVVTQPAQAATKLEVGSLGCMSFAQARAQHPNAHLKYRQIQADKCWYNPAVFAKHTPKVRVTGEGAVPSTHAAGSRATPSAIVRGQPDTRSEVFEDELEGIFLVLCGGPCPQNAHPPAYLLRRPGVGGRR